MAKTFISFFFICVGFIAGVLVTYFLIRNNPDYINYVTVSDYIIELDYGSQKEVSLKLMTYLADDLDRYNAFDNHASQGFKYSIEPPRGDEEKFKKLGAPVSCEMIPKNGFAVLNVVSKWSGACIIKVWHESNKKSCKHIFCRVRLCGKENELHSTISSAE